jgi:hypothetical protein
MIGRWVSNINPISYIVENKEVMIIPNPIFGSFFGKPCTCCYRAIQLLYSAS